MKNDFTFWLIFDLSPNLGLSDKSQRKTDSKSEMAATVLVISSLLCEINGR